ncbi:hypothetical protein T12_13652 [Trichinella patagoniensis]|uniref:Uncharacterized protein n=1 Tax=Trichinella patagoniensis TaxID=990121 RepID=A0A0V0ZBY9_9BILA|nr:hypothetical protein T12_13652 [Trichinella patagoniensis]
MLKTSVELCEKLNTCLKLCDFHMAYSHCSIVIMTLLAISREPESEKNSTVKLTPVLASKSVNEVDCKKKLRKKFRIILKN